jgi:cyclic dehypoxanthinyl futalosine synthase
VARLYLDNFANIQSSWVTQGLKTGQLALLYGANDMGSLMIEENVVAEAGTVHYLTLDEIRGAIEELGYVARQRNVRYEWLDSEHEQRAIDANRVRYAQIRNSQLNRHRPNLPAANGAACSQPIVPLSVAWGDGTA